MRQFRNMINYRLDNSQKNFLKTYSCIELFSKFLKKQNGIESDPFPIVAVEIFDVLRQPIID